MNPIARITRRLLGFTDGHHGLHLRIPAQSGHRFHGKLDSDSSANWTAGPRQTGQLK